MLKNLNKELEELIKDYKLQLNIFELKLKSANTEYAEGYYEALVEQTEDIIYTLEDLRNKI